MKCGTFKCGEAKTARRCVQVSCHDGLTAYGTAQIGPQTVGIGQLVSTTAPAHWINGYRPGQQADGRKWRHGKHEVLAPSSGSVQSTPLAHSGGKCYALAEGKWVRQELDDEIVPDYVPLVFSCYAYKPSANDGTLALEWSTDQETITVSAATATTITDLSQSWTPGEWVGSCVLMRSGDGQYQDDRMLISANDGNTLTFSSELATLPQAGDTGDIVTWTGPTMYRLDNATGAAAATGVVRSTAEWQRFYVCLRPLAPFNRLHVRLRAIAGTIWVDSGKLEAATPLERGISTSTTATTLTDTARGWASDEQAGRRIIIFDGDDAGDSVTISGNSRQTLTAAFAVTPSANSTYAIYPPVASRRPTAFVDLGLLTLALQQISAYDVAAGTLLVGGGLADAPRLVVEDADGEVILKAGDNLDEDGFRGLRFLHGAAAAFEGGYIIMRPDQGHDDSGQRIRMSFEGLEGFDSHDVRRWGLYSEAGGFEFTLGTSPLQGRIVIDCDYGIAAIDDQGRTWFDVNPMAEPHWFWVGLESDNKWMKFDSVNGLQLSPEALAAGIIQQKLTLGTGGEIIFGEELMRMHTSGLTRGVDTPETDAFAQFAAAGEKHLYLDCYSTTPSNTNDIKVRKSASAVLGDKAQTADGEYLGTLRFAGVNTSGDFAEAVKILGFQHGAAGADYVPGGLAILLGTDAAVPVEKFRFTKAAQLLLNTTSGRQTPVGIVIDQAAYDSPVLQFCSSDVAHGMTGVFSTDVWGSIAKTEGDAGGMALFGSKDADGVAGGALQLTGNLGEAADTTKSTAGIGVVDIVTGVKSGTGVTAVGADGNLLTIRNQSTCRFIFDAEGSAHSDVEWTTYDEEDDLALLTALEEQFAARAVTAEFGALLQEHRELLQGAGIVNFYDDGPRAMVNWTRLAMLLVGALRQMGRRIDQCEQRQLAAGLPA